MQSQPTESLTPIVREEVCCSLCGSTRRTPVLHAPDRIHHVPGIFTVCQCLDCGLLYQNPRPSAASFEAIYVSDYGPYQPAEATAHIPYPDFIPTCNLIQQLQPRGGDLLDVGCGAGTFLRTLTTLQPGWRTAGIEPHPQAAARSRHYGITVYETSLETSSLDPARWDAITLWNVLEHLPDPVTSLKRLHQSLRPSGMLYLAVPVYDSWDRRLSGATWVGWELPRHFVIFSKATLRAMLAHTGFDIVRTACISGLEYCFTESLRLMIHQHIRSYTLDRLGTAVTHSRPFHFALRPFLMLMRILQQGTILTLAARPAADALNGQQKERL